MNLSGRPWSTETPLPGTTLTPASAAAGRGQPAAAPAGLPACPVCAALHAVPRAQEVPAAHPLPTGRLFHHFHAALCRFQWLPDVPHHVPGTQVWGLVGEGRGEGKWASLQGRAHPASGQPSPSCLQVSLVPPCQVRSQLLSPPQASSWGAEASTGEVPAYCSSPHSGGSSLGLSFPIHEINGLDCHSLGPSYSPNSQLRGS